MIQVEDDGMATRLVTEETIENRERAERRALLKRSRKLPTRKAKEAPRFHEVLNGDCLQMLKTLDANSVHSVVTDPPAGISFMGKGWDDDKGGRDQWVKWLTEVMVEVKRVLRPGGHALVWALPRTSHWTASAIEDAGFEIRDVIIHLFGCGYPKGQDISKLIDKRAGMARQVVGHKQGTQVVGQNADGSKKRSNGKGEPGAKSEKVVLEITGAATSEAKKWEGWSSALKPSAEAWILAYKPYGILDGIRLIHDQVIQLGGHVWSALSAEKSSTSRLAISEGEKLVRENVPGKRKGDRGNQTPTGEAGDSSDQTATSSFESTVTTFLSIAALWKSILDDGLNLVSTSTIGTETRLTIDWSTLSCLISQITPASIIQAASNQSGLPSGVLAVDATFNALRVQFDAIRALSAPGLAGEPVDSSPAPDRESHKGASVRPTVPGSEFFILARKPMAFDSLAENVKRCEAGALNIDECRVPIVGEKPPEFRFSETAPHGTGNSFCMGKTTIDKVRGMTWTAHEKGRWPANTVLSHAPGCVKQGTKKIKGSPPSERDKPCGGFKPGGGSGGKESNVTECIGYADEDGNETVEDWTCAPDCPVRIVDEQAGQVASRYFNRFESEPSFAYVPKATIAERNVGTEKLAKRTIAEANGDGGGVQEGADEAKGNIHPTVKSLALMSHLIKLITPPGGIVLDPFAGSGTTLVAAKRIGRSAIGIEREYEYWKICKARLENGGAYV